MNMHLAILCISFATFTGCVHAAEPTKSASWGGYYYKHEPANAPPSGATPTHLELPPVPAGCVVRVYHVKPREYPGAPRRKTDWAEFLRAQGMVFPRGGFAAYFPPTATLIVANTSDQLALLDPF